MSFLGNDMIFFSWNLKHDLFKIDDRLSIFPTTPPTCMSLCKDSNHKHIYIYSQKFTTRFLSNFLLYDGRSTFGKNIFNIIKECKSRFEDISPKTVKFNLKYWVPSVQEEIRIEMAKELMSAKDNVNKIEGFSQKEIMEMFTNICIH